MSTTCCNTATPPTRHLRQLTKNQQNRALTAENAIFLLREKFHLMVPAGMTLSAVMMTTTPSTLSAGKMLYVLEAGMTLLTVVSTMMKSTEKPEMIP